MQDPIRAMKIYGDVNGEFSIVNLVRPELFPRGTIISMWLTHRRANSRCRITTARVSTSDYTLVFEERVLQAGLGRDLTNANCSRNTIARCLYETIHSNDCYFLAVVLLRRMRAVEKLGGKCVGC